MVFSICSHEWFSLHLSLAPVITLRRPVLWLIGAILPPLLFPYLLTHPFATCASIAKQPMTYSHLLWLQPLSPASVPVTLKRFHRGKGQESRHKSDVSRRCLSWLFFLVRSNEPVTCVAMCQRPCGDRLHLLIFFSLGKKSALSVLKKNVEIKLCQWN